jgi:hypothetical protein
MYTLPLFGVWIFHVIKETIFRSNQEVANTIFIPVNDSRAGRMAGKNMV